MLPKGIRAGLQHFAQDPRLWKLLGSMLQPDPVERASSAKALEALTSDEALAPDDPTTAYFQAVVENSDTCPMPPDSAMFMRPLSVVASFSRSEPFGLVLCTKYDEVGQGDELSPEDQRLWEEATVNAREGDVFIRGINPGSQAAKLGRLRVGDRLTMVGDFNVSEQGGGFDR